MVNEFRAGFNQFYNVKAGEFAYTRDVMSELKIPGISLLPSVAWGTPEVRIQGFLAPVTASTFGDIDGPYTNKNRVYQAIDNFSWTRGNHSFRFGGELRWDQYNQLGNLFSRGQFQFGPSVTTRLTDGFGWK